MPVKYTWELLDEAAREAVEAYREANAGKALRTNLFDGAS